SAAAGSAPSASAKKPAANAVLTMQPLGSPSVFGGQRSLIVAAASTGQALARPAPSAYVAGMAQPSHERDEAQRREALASLQALGEGDTFVTSALARTAQRTSDHFAAK